MPTLAENKATGHTSMSEIHYPLEQKIKREKVVLLDDEFKFLNLAQKCLKDKGYDLKICETPEEALEIIQFQGTVAVIITDQRMPSMTGIEFLKKIKTISPTSVRILLTANPGDASLFEEAINNGEIYRYLKKPLDFKQADKIIHEALEQYQRNVEANAMEYDLFKFSSKFDKLLWRINRLKQSVERQTFYKRILAGLLTLILLTFGISLGYQRLHDFYLQETSKEVYGRWFKYTNGTALDTQTDLVWMTWDFRLIKRRAPAGWSEAVAWVGEINKNSYAGHKDWRLPTAKELQSIVQKDSERIGFDNNTEVFASYPAAFEDGGGYHYWSSESLDAENAKIFTYLGEGKLQVIDKKYADPAVSVRLVRRR